MTRTQLCDIIWTKEGIETNIKTTGVDPLRLIASSRLTIYFIRVYFTKQKLGSQWFKKSIL